MSTDIGFQLDVLVRLVAAVALGAALGLEREIHGHPAGMRTHILVALGSAVFTVLSIFGFPASGATAPSDPSRVAAQIVTGIGFLGAGAILKYGTSIRGLTTAASLWVVASIGLACGAGAWFVAVTGTALALLALWPLHALVERLGLTGGQAYRLRIGLRKLAAFAPISQILLSNNVEIRSIESRKTKVGHSIDLELWVPRRSRSQLLLAEIEALPDVSVEELAESVEA
jgi:putative Mg2+ transporter-C (MgtC) family protein